MLFVASKDTMSIAGRGGKPPPPGLIRPPRAPYHFRSAIRYVAAAAAPSRRRDTDRPAAALATLNKNSIVRRQKTDVDRKSTRSNAAGRLPAGRSTCRSRWSPFVDRLPFPARAPGARPRDPAAPHLPPPPPSGP